MNVEYDEHLDSLRFEQVLKDALKVARQNCKSTNFYKAYEQFVDSSFSSDVDITIGHLFSKSKKHAIIRRRVPWAVYVNVYQISGDEFTSVINHEQRNMTYTDDTIRDINGDGQKDFIVNWYGDSGCCLKGFSNVYLYRGHTGSFTYDYQFINPTFSPDEHIIRGVCYGHPGETEMYKYKWNGEQVDTIAYIFFEKDTTGTKTGKFIESNRRPSAKVLANKKRLNAVPEEYISIEGFDWFMGKVN